MPHSVAMPHNALQKIAHVKKCPIPLQMHHSVAMLCKMLHSVAMPHYALQKMT